MVKCRVCGRVFDNKYGRSAHERQAHTQEEVKKVQRYRDKKWLYNQYVNKKNSIDDIAEICDCSKNTIWVWLKKHDIEIRDQSETLKINGKLNGKNNPNYGKSMSEETKEKIRNSEYHQNLEGPNNPFYNKSHTKEIREKLSNIMERAWKSGEVSKKRQEWLSSEEAKQIAINNLPNDVSGSKNPNWKGGTSGWYGWKWRTKITKKVKERDNHKCQKCGMTEEEHRKKFGRGLVVHHIIPRRLFTDKDKADSPFNLITLCDKCHLEIHSNS